MTKVTRLLPLALVLLIACGGGTNYDGFYSATLSLGISEDERLGAGESTCDGIREMVNTYDEPASLGKAEAYVFARNANADREQARVLVRASTRYLCPEHDDPGWGRDVLLDDLEDCLAFSPQPVPEYCPVQYSD